MSNPENVCYPTHFKSASLPVDSKATKAHPESCPHSVLGREGGDGSILQKIKTEMQRWDIAIPHCSVVAELGPRIHPFRTYFWFPAGYRL